MKRDGYIERANGTCDGFDPTETLTTSDLTEKGQIRKTFELTENMKAFAELNALVERVINDTLQTKEEK